MLSISQSNIDLYFMRTLVLFDIPLGSEKTLIEAVYPLSAHIA